MKIEVKNLNLWYGPFQALKDIKAEFREKSITAIIGPSGCGKSTLLRVFNRMNDLIESVRTSGEVLIDGENIIDTKMDLVRLRKKVGMVFQRPNPFPLTIYENIVFGPRIHGVKATPKDLDKHNEPRASARGSRAVLARGPDHGQVAPDRASLDGIVECSLKSVLLWDDLKDRLQRSALSLSLEQKQRLCIARLIAVRSDVLLMDEPCSALDPAATQKIEELMRELSQHYTIVIVTHNMQQAARISEETGFMLLGELIEFGKTENIFTRPKDKRTEDYITGRYG